MNNYGQFFTNDVEFYHDKGGITNGLKRWLKFLKKLVQQSDFRIRREEMKGTEVFPMQNLIYLWCYFFW